MVGNTTTVVISKLLVCPLVGNRGNIAELERYFSPYYQVGKSALLTKKGIFWPMGEDYHLIKNNYPKVRNYSMLLGIYNEQKLLLELMKEPQTFKDGVVEELDRELTFKINECRIF